MELIGRAACSRTEVLSPSDSGRHGLRSLILKVEGELAPSAAAFVPMHAVSDVERIPRLAAVGESEG